MLLAHSSHSLLRGAAASAGACGQIGCSTIGGSRISIAAHKVSRVSFLARAVASVRRLVVPPVFVIDLRDGGGRVRSGEPPAALVAEFSQAANDLGLASGTIYVVRASHGVTLEFSPEIPESAHQRLRNILSVHRHRIKGG